jgi:glycolate oxidase FAD binding subunit
VLVQLCGSSALDRAARIDGEVVEDDEELWAAQRAAQRGPVVLRVSTTQQGLDEVLAAAHEHRAICVARAAHGLAWLRFEAADAQLVTALRARLGACVLLDAPAALRREVDPWGPLSAEPLMRRIKARFDPYDTLNPGLLLT